MLAFAVGPGYIPRLGHGYIPKLLFGCMLITVLQLTESVQPKPATLAVAKNLRVPCNMDDMKSMNDIAPTDDSK